MPNPNDGEIVIMEGAYKECWLHRKPKTGSEESSKENQGYGECTDLSSAASSSLMSLYC